MKRQREILFKILFLLVVFFSYGINSYSNISIQQYSIDLSTDNNSDEDRFSSNNDSMSEDQITQTEKFDLNGGLACKKQNSRDFSEVYNFCPSVWQPPKIF